MQRAVVGAVAALSRAFLVHGCRRLRVSDAEVFFELLRDSSRTRGVLTCA
jgi:hypothetical protein